MEQVTTIQYIPMWMVNVSPMNPRKTFDQASLEELADNIKRQGLLQPITVRPVDYRDELTDGEVVSIPSQYEIVCGERRYRAVKLNGDETIPCIVRDMNTAPYNVRYEILGSKHAKETDYAKAHNTGEGRDDVIRRWLRGKLSDSGVIYNPVLQECQERLIEVWGIDDVQVKAKAAEKLRKKQEKIEKALTKLGYDTEGKKLAF